MYTSDLTVKGLAVMAIGFKDWGSIALKEKPRPLVITKKLFTVTTTVSK